MSDARVAIITGASSGIGAATARELARAGYLAAVGARRVERLEALAHEIESSGGRAFAHPLDVTDPDSVERFCGALEKASGPASLLVNNAGANRSALVAEATVEELRFDVEVNLLGAMYMTRRVLPGMIERLAGDVVFIGSDSAPHPRPYQAAYGAAKAGLETFAEVVGLETEGTGVRSILLRVGPTGSEFGNSMPKDKLKEILASWQHFGVYRSHHWMTAEAVARTVVRTVEIPVEEAYPRVVEVHPGGRKKEFRR